ncbi:hypothetical protein Ctha_0750 [Chloroherpeton thalassium ATCC 35110]|uniref:Glycine zipper domain-containing protein n=1 Tax=Chloroherpeton thalassium (strain ATCC 35110 / GB-78) TaxID=517418 RepID=B3QWA6_CHLT3|nr:glycine zipper domain-containing protein [Chloroherpeton thalassium]ACF13219.1 hypothetical protein Ctha_0750 [Chloroherpeton thalassium ATCC 35110]
MIDLESIFKKKEEDNDGVAKTIVTGMGIIGGSGGCSLIGAAFGFLAGPMGAVVGAIPGAVIGGLVGGFVGNKVGEQVDKNESKKRVAEQYQWLQPGEELIIEERIKK